MTTPPSKPARGQGTDNALACFDDIAAALKGRSPALFLDYDGTLVPLARRPELAVATPRLRDTVARLSTLMPVAVVSGRGREDVSQMLGVDGIAYAGSHGFDIRDASGADLSGDIGAPYRPALEAAASALAERLAPIAGTFLEDKTYSIAIHYREAAPDTHDVIRAAVDEEVARRDTLKRTGGKMIHELRPDLDWDKGTAVLRVMETLSLTPPDAVPVYIGDDETDEDAFRAICDSGIGIKVADAGDDAATLARYRLGTPAEVTTFLGRLADYLEMGGASA